MPSKKERIEYLETQVAGLHDKLSETIQELEELKKRVGNTWLIPTTPPINVPSIFPYSGQIKVTCTPNSIVSNGVTYHYKTPKPELKEGV